MILIQFLTLTFAISLAGFVCIYFIPAARSPESAIGLPFWLIMVWGPSLAAIVLSTRDGHLMELLGRVVKISTVPVDAWALVLAPLVLLLLLRPIAPEGTTTLGASMLLAMIAFNLILGPLGEELGWRGYFQDSLNPKVGWLTASLIVGAVWFVWHLPLWVIESPHSQISLALYGGHVMCYAIIIGAAYTLSGGSILPAILIHLTVNLAANLAIFSGFRDPNSWFSSSLLPYFLIAVFAVGLVFFRTGQSGVDGSGF